MSPGVPVSRKGTVSAIMKARQTVKQSTRDHVLEVMKDCAFARKVLQETLRTRDRTRVLASSSTVSNYPFYTTIATGVKEFANSKGYSAVLASSENHHETEKRLTHLFSSKDIKGAIVAPIVEGTAEIVHLFHLKMINYPFVLLEDVKGIQGIAYFAGHRRAS
jgi:LacI family transcriptional regulator, galactose operon repressor